MMKILVLVCSHDMNRGYLDNLLILHEHILSQEPHVVDYCAISNKDDFANMDNSTFEFKYKIVNPSMQLSKVCDFITDHKDTLSYDWYLKIRPDMKLLEPIIFTGLSSTAIHARARKYHGPLQIRYGMSVNGEGLWKHIGDCSLQPHETELILDDMMFLFHDSLIRKGAFESVHNQTEKEHEWFQTMVWRSRGIPLQVLGINVLNTKYQAYSGDLNL